MKKVLKVLLYIVLFLCVWAGLTKLGVIPNWFNIKFVDANGCFFGYEKKYGNCHRIGWPRYGGGFHLFGLGCLNCELFDAASECGEYYKMPDVEGYSRENYEMWVKEKYPDYVKDEMAFTREYLKSISDNGGLVDTDLQDLSREKFYDEWVNEKFDGYQDALKEYEKHQAGCRLYTGIM